MGLFLIISTSILILLFIVAWIKNIKWLGVIGGILTFSLIPLYIDFLGVGKFMTSWNIGEWSGFLGSYLGGGIGAFITLGGIWWQLNEGKKIEKERKIENEVTSFLTFLVILRETAENYSYLISAIQEKLAKNKKIGTTFEKISENNFIIKNDIFSQSISTLNIQCKPLAIELFFLFDKYSIDGKDNFFLTIQEYLDSLYCFYNKLYSELDLIIDDYEKQIKNSNKNIINIHISSKNTLEQIFKSIKPLANSLNKKAKKKTSS